MSRRVLSVLAIPLLMSVGCAVEDESETEDENDTTQASFGYHYDPQKTRNRAGIAEAYSPLGSLPALEASNPFFADLGTNGRTCASCHGFEGGWTTSHADLLWSRSNGTDPLFMATFDIGKCAESDISTRRKRRDAMELTLERGSVRAGITRIQPTAEYEVTAVEDPYDCEITNLTQFYGYRKPNPLTGVSQKTSVTWAPGPQPDMRATLKGLFIGATQFHGATTYVPTDEEQEEATDFMLFNYFAQIYDEDAGRLDDDGARGGPVHLAGQDFFVGINHASTGPTTRKVFDIFDAWIDSDSGHHRYSRKWKARALIAEGQEIFNFRENANGGTCSGCHNAPNVGTRSVYQLFDIGAVDIDDPELPRVHLRHKTTGETRIVNNLGRAAATGLWADVGKMSVPLLRGLSSRGPYFNSGQAKTLMDVVEHYNARFSFNFTYREKKALAAFLSAL
jgi:cytochrome c peroxidase